MKFNHRKFIKVTQEIVSNTTNNGKIKSHIKMIIPTNTIEKIIAYGDGTEIYFNNGEYTITVTESLGELYEMLEPIVFLENDVTYGTRI
jgi:hypothetical protein